MWEILGLIILLVIVIIVLFPSRKEKISAAAPNDNSNVAEMLSERSQNRTSRKQPQENKVNQEDIGQISYRDIHNLVSDVAFSGETY